MDSGLLQDGGRFISLLTGKVLGENLENYETISLQSTSTCLQCLEYWNTTYCAGCLKAVHCCMPENYSPLDLFLWFQSWIFCSEERPVGMQQCALFKRKGIIERIERINILKMQFYSSELILSILCQRSVNVTHINVSLALYVTGFPHSCQVMAVLPVLKRHFAESFSGPSLFDFIGYILFGIQVLNIAKWH